MPLIKPFRGFRPSKSNAQAVVAPPYDVVSKEEARNEVTDKPYSFLHVTRPEIDLENSVDPYSPLVYQTGKKNLASLISQGMLEQDKAECYYLYRMEVDGHCQTGIGAVCSVKAYEEGDIKRHELTRFDKENDRIKHIDCLNTQASPVLLSCKPKVELRRLMDQYTQKEASLQVQAAGVTHSIWVLDEEDKIRSISAIFNGQTPEGKFINPLYIADGHHRSAAASKVAQLRSKANPDHTGEENYNYFLAVIYPSDQMNILDYNRVIKDLNGLSQQDFLDALKKDFQITPSKQAVSPKAPGEFGMYIAPHWYHLQIINQPASMTDFASRLDVSRLYRLILAPILAIADQRTDKRIDFIGGIRGLSALETRVNTGEMAVAFSLYPTQMEQIMTISDANEIMPPKSTWFEPKLIDGLLCHKLD